MGMKPLPVDNQSTIKVPRQGCGRLKIKPKRVMKQLSRAYKAPASFFPRTRPAYVRARQARSFPETIARAKRGRSGSRDAVSRENAEKVVNPPRKPVVTRSLVSFGISGMTSKQPAARPMRKLPAKLTIRVPGGNAGQRWALHAPIRQRRTAPSPAPIKTSNACTAMCYISLPLPAGSRRRRRVHCPESHRTAFSRCPEGSSPCC